MSAYNTLKFSYKVPSINEEIELTIQFKYGNTWQYEYKVGDELRWGGNDIGKPGRKKVVVDGCLEGIYEYDNIPEDFEVHVENDILVAVIPSTGKYDFVRNKETYVVIEE